MKLVLSLMCVAFTSAMSPAIVFDKPRETVVPSEIPKIFPTRVNLQSYPLAVEAVLSVALKLQSIENHDGEQRNFLVSPLAVAGALGQLMLGAKGDLRKQIAVLLTLQDETGSIVDNTPAALIEPQITDNRAATVQLRMSNPVAPSSVKGSGNIFSRLGTVSALNAGSYQSHSVDMPQFSTMARDGLPGLELHRQLGRLIRDLSLPLPRPGAVHPVANSSYLHSSSAFFVDHKLNLNEPYVRAIVDFYDSKVVSLNFSSDSVGAQNTVNSWGSRETGGLIENFLAYPPPLDTAVIQAVAVHFRGAWQTPFIPEGTIPGLFQTSANTEVPVKFMRGSFEQAYYAEDDNLRLRLLALPYSHFDCAMYVVLPMDDSPLKYNVGHLVSHLTSKQLADLVGKAKQRTVNVMFPKLSLTGSLSLVSALEKHAAFLNKQQAEQAANTVANSTITPTAPVGIRASARAGNSMSRVPGTFGNPRTNSQMSVENSVTDPLRVIPLDTPKSSAGSAANRVPANTTAGNIRIAPRSSGVEDVPDATPAKPPLILTGAAEGSMFRISDVIQQIALEVNEAGTEAAAIAGSTVNYSGDVKNFKVNRPFLFFIRQEETNAILFWGTIVDPTA